MKNWEKYEEEIKAIGINNFSITKDEEVVECGDHGCYDCKFNGDSHCMDIMSHWLYEEAEDFNERD